MKNISGTKINLIAGILIILLYIPGCQAFKALTFSHHEKSGNKEGQMVSLIYLVNGISKPTEWRPPETKFSENEIPSGLKETIENSCIEDEEIPLAAIPLIAAGGKFIFDLGADYLAKIVEKVRQKSTASYSARLIVDETMFNDKNQKECLLFFRYKKIPQNGFNESSIGMILVVEVKKFTSTFSLIPTFLWFGDAVAETGNEEVPEIDAAVAITVKAYGRTNSNSTPADMKNIVEETFQFKKIELGEKPRIRCEAKNCKIFSSLLVPPSPNGKGATISISVVETGSHASKLDKAEAQLKALKTALGPAAKDALTKQLTPN